MRQMADTVLDFEKLSDADRAKIEDRIRETLGDDPVEYQAVAPVLQQKFKKMSYWDLAMIWFGANIIIATWAVGALATTVFGLDPVGAIISIAIGNLMGSLMLAATSAMGRNGNPQPMFSIPIFGYKGAKIPNFLLCFTTLGWTTANTVLSSLAIFALIKIFAPSAGSVVKVMIVLAITAVCVLVASNKFIVARNVEKYAAYLMMAFLVVLSYFCIKDTNWAGAASEFTGQNSFSYIMMFLSAAGAIGIGYIGTWSPYGADYARYVNMEKWDRQKKVFWWSLAGGFAVSTWMECVGALFAYMYKTFDPALHVVKTIPSFAIPALIIMIAGALATVVLNYLSVGVQLKALGVKVGRRACTWIVSIIVFILALYSVLFTDISHTYHAFLVALLIWVVPWVVMQIMDYYIITKGNYSVLALYGIEKIYPDYDWRGLGTLIAGFIFSGAFAYAGNMKLFGVIPLYSPIMEKYFYCGDISYFVGGVVTFILYWFLKVKPNNEMLKDNMPVGG